jgi:hypothetical protein
MDNSTSLWLERVRRRQALMDRVIEKCAVDVLKAVRAQNGDAFFTARAWCLACPHEADCRNWCVETSERLPPIFCPNADFFRACRRPPPDKHETIISNVSVKRRKQPSHAPFEERASKELIKLIWKLRWLGEDAEANNARRQLNRILARQQVVTGAPHAASTCGMLNETD